jgi:hypothetical protein
MVVCGKSIWKIRTRHSGQVSPATLPKWAMTGFLQEISGWPGAAFLQKHWVAYLVVNAAHILDIGLHLGAILRLDLLLLRSSRGRHLPILDPFLVRAVVRYQ